MQTFHAIIMLNFRTVFSASGLSDILQKHEENSNFFARKSYLSLSNQYN